MAAVVLCAAGWITWTATPNQPPQLETPNIPADFPDRGLVAWYLFNGNADDASGNGNHGTGYNVSFVPDRFGELNSDVALHDTESVIHVNDSPSLDLSASMTISACIKFETHGHSHLVMKGESIQENYSVSFAPWGDMGLAARMTDGTRELDPVGGPRHRLQMNPVWQHLVLTYDAGLGLVQSFVDGRLHRSGRFPARSPQVNDHALLIGNSADQDRFLNGAIDDLRIYGRALNDAEVQVLYRQETQSESRVGSSA